MSKCKSQIAWFLYHRFRWYATLENKTPAETFPKFPSVSRVIDISDQNPPITATSVLFIPSLRHASGLWLVVRSVDNMYDWRKFWKRFRGCFVFEGPVSTKTVVSFDHQVYFHILIISWQLREAVSHFSLENVVPITHEQQNKFIRYYARRDHYL